MNGRHITLLVLFAATAAQADPRVTTRFYQARDVVTLQGRAGIETTIVFAPDEHIENIAVGNPAAWQVTPNKRANVVFVRPAGGSAHTNMTVLTDQRSYLFDLVSRAGGAPTYMLRFTYPASPPKPVALPAMIPDAAVKPPPGPPATKPADLNFDWRFRGDKGLMPARSFDDGRSIFLQWGKDVALPAILVREASGLEGPVNYTVQGAYIVIDGVPTELILRTGKRKGTLVGAPRPATMARPAALPLQTAENER